MALVCILFVATVEFFSAWVEGRAEEFMLVREHLREWFVVKAPALLGASLEL